MFKSIFTHIYVYIDGCWVYYIARNTLVILLEAVFARKFLDVKLSSWCTVHLSLKVNNKV